MTRHTEKNTSGRRWARSVLLIAMATSVTANILAAQPTPTGRAVSAVAPVALILAIELIARIPSSGAMLGRVRIGAAGVIAAIAGLVSYGHMRALSLSAGESELAAALLPFVVDGLVVVSAVSLADSGRSSPITEDSTLPDERPELVAVMPVAARPEPVAGTSLAATGSTVPKPTGDEIRALALAEPDLTQVALAERLDVNERTIRRHLNGSIR